MNKGDSTTEGMIILAVLLVIIILMPKGSPNSTDNTSQNTSSNGAVISTPNSSYAQDITINSGNAAYVYQSYEEYITIYNYGRNSIDITNWQLKNGKDKRAYDSGGSLQYFSSDIAIIPKAALFISPYGYSALQNVVLKSGEQAIVTTGVMGSQSPYKIVSFKENSCSGYLEDLPEYAFTPPLSRNCPRPADELGVSNQSSECRKFIERMSSCHTPEFDTRDRDGEICHNCVDGTPLTSSCVAFIKNHFNYNSCIANHSSDTNFSGQTWRIFLGKGWEMWAKEYETIELFDQLGRLVEYRDY
ncbi:MAG: hypothetical protein WAX80_00725 [Minisyncoccia bacterium]